MQSNYKRIGDYIKEVKQKNVTLEATLLLGININKFFMPSVANVIGTDMSNYRIVKKNQFACNRMHVGRDYRIPVALSNREEPFMVSPAYDVFEIIDTSVLLPEYLMMWFSRKEFDRNAWFYTDADVRGGLHWKAFCDMQLPIPSPEKQREIVKEYHILVDRIALNNQLISKLEETAQAIYKQWFVDFEFPDENGLPYKSNGGEMVWCEELEKEIPVGWSVNRISSLCDVLNGRAYKETEFVEKGTPIIRIQNLNGGKKYVYSDLNLEDNKYVENGDLIFAWSATFGPFIWRNKRSIYHYHIWKLNCFKKEFKFLLFQYFFLETKRVSGEGSGSIFAHITKALMESQLVLTPNEKILKSFHLLSVRIDKQIELSLSESNLLSDLIETILARMTKFESETHALN
jgi:type I restriction enzyme S subunit